MEQPGGLSITLHKYQRECVHWMKSVEDSVPYMFKYLPAVLWPKLKGDVVFNFDGHPTSIHSSDLNYLIFQVIHNFFLEFPIRLVHEVEFLRTKWDWEKQCPCLV
jgi:hypothetical protein